MALFPPVALGVIAALTQSPEGGASQRALARALGTPDSSVQAALALLLRERVVTRQGSRARARYWQEQAHAAAGDLIGVALNALDTQRVLEVLLRANEEVEFASVRRDGARLRLFVVFTEGADAAQVRLSRALDRIRTADVELFAETHDELIRRLRDEPALREQAAAGRVLKGSLARSLPERRRPDSQAHPIGRLHPEVPIPSRRSLAALARRYGVTRLGVFGSAVRSDFRPDSDIDVLVRYEPGRAKTLEETAAFEAELERTFGRDVDLVDERYVGERMRPRIAGEEVVLHQRG